MVSLPGIINRRFFRVDGPVQIHIGPSSFVTGYRDSWIEPEAYLPSFLGFSRIFSSPQPVTMDCVPHQEREIVPIFCLLHPETPARGQGMELPIITPLQKEICDTELMLREYNARNRHDRCILDNQRDALLGLANSIDVYRIDMEIEKARLLIDEMKGYSPPAAAHGFWRGWDAIFFVGMAIVAFSGKIMQFIRGLRTVRIDEPFELSGGIGRGDAMGKDRRKELWKTYIEGLKKLMRRADAAKSIEECREITVEQMKLDEWLEKEDPELFKSKGREESGRLGHALDLRVEYLGGPRAPAF